MVQKPNIKPRRMETETERRRWQQQRVAITWKMKNENNGKMCEENLNNKATTAEWENTPHHHHRYDHHHHFTTKMDTYTPVWFGVWFINARYVPHFCLWVCVYLGLFLSLQHGSFHFIIFLFVCLLVCFCFSSCLLISFSFFWYFKFFWHFALLLAFKLQKSPT